MIKSVASLAALAGAVVLACNASAEPTWNGKPVVPRFVTIPNQAPLNYPNGKQPVGTLPNWAGTFVDLKGHTVNYKHVGADPAQSNTDTHVKTFIIPVVFVYGASNGNMTFDPSAAHVHGHKNVIKNMLASPLFDNGKKFKSGHIVCGTGQYIDVYQRCNFWNSVSTNTAYHTVLDYTKNKNLEPLVINVAGSEGSVIQNPTSSETALVGTYPINNFDVKLGTYMTTHAADITPDTFPFFVSYDVYLTSGSCCIGGYHSARGGTQTYGYTTYVDQYDADGVFSEDIAAASHEIGEWQDDPFTNNHVFCTDNSIMENGDPLVIRAKAYGAFPAKLNGFTYHPQSLVFMPYFGAPTSTSANGWYALHGPDDMTHACPGQQ